MSEPTAGGRLEVFERFLGDYSPDSSEIATPWARSELAAVADLPETIGRWGGVSFNSGVYRVHSESSSRAATVAIKPYLQEPWNDAIAFAFDWLGRNFAVSPRLWSTQSPVIYVVGMGEARVFEIPVSIVDFYDVELVDYAEDVLASGWFAEWREARNGIDLKFDQCVGYRRPIFLGGTDDDENLEIVDTDVYWSLVSQICGQVKGLPEGTSIASLRIDPSFRDNRDD